MKKIIKQKPQKEQSIDILKRVAKRVEEATIDIHSIKYDIKAMKLDMGFMQSDFAIMKVDVEKMKSDVAETKNQLEEVENRLGKRISHVADLITISMGQKFKIVQKRIQKIERLQQAA